MLGKLRRVSGLRSLLHVNEHISALRERVNRLGRRTDRLKEQTKNLHNNLRDQRGVLEDHDTAIRNLQDALQGHEEQMRIHDTSMRNLENAVQVGNKAVQDQIAYLSDQLDMLKSSLDVPASYIEEFAEWRAGNPIPERPLVSVTVATYNRARLLTERCIPSVLGQTYDNLELVVVGDGCTDETEELVSRIRDPRLKFVNLPRRSTYPVNPRRRWMVAGTTPFNKTLSMSKGYFLTHLDDDDEYAPDRLEKLVELALQHDCDIVWHPFWWEDVNSDSWTVLEATDFVHGQITNASVLYRSWFARFESEIDAHRLHEPGDWNRYRRMKYLDPVLMRHPKPLLRKYR